MEGDKWYSYRELEYNMLSDERECRNQALKVERQRTEECVLLTSDMETVYCLNDEI
jgi:hypothetical protein